MTHREKERDLRLYIYIYSSKESKKIFTLLSVHFLDLVNLNWCETELFQVLLVVYVIHRKADVDGRLDGFGYLDDGFRRRGYVYRYSRLIACWHNTECLSIAMRNSRCISKHSPMFYHVRPLLEILNSRRYPLVWILLLLLWRRWRWWRWWWRWRWRRRWRRWRRRLLWWLVM